MTPAPGERDPGSRDHGRQYIARNFECPRRAWSIPWHLQPCALFAIDAACFAANIWTGSVESARLQRDAFDTGKVVGLTGPVSVAVTVIFIAIGIGALLTVAWAIRAWSHGRPRGFVFLSALALIGLALITAWDVSAFTLSYQHLRILNRP
ncbi:MAG: hypothetical protein J2P25_09300 [Nocardiopsaceae bacterium]|nr:hypothetical protein [Nocardiopsaceae bacterium]